MNVTVCLTPMRKRGAMQFMVTRPERDKRIRTRTARVATREMMGAVTTTAANADSLVVIYGGIPADITRRYLLERSHPAYTIGRSSECDVVLESTSASRHHARIERVDAGWVIRDLGSLNGTWVNDRRVTDPLPLSHNDRIQVGDVIFKHLSGDDVEAEFAEAIRLALVTDGLTQAANERAFRTALVSAVRRARAEGTPVTLVIADLDHFKSVNDKYGHSAGDRVLREFVRIVRRECNEHVQLARVGGEEFAMLITGHGVAEARSLAERARAAVEAHIFSAPESTLRITASFGVAQLGDEPEDGTGLFKRADAQLYEAKRAGRNCVRG